MLLTFGDFQAGAASRITGVCTTSPDFAAYTNQATRQLMRRGNWWSTVQPLEGCVTDGCVTWPRQVGSILGVNINGRPTELVNRWYRFLPWDPSTVAGACECFQNRAWGNLKTELDGNTPVFNPIACATGMYLQFYIDNQADIGKTITLFGIDNNGQYIRTQVNGVWQEGITLTFSAPYVQTPMLVRKVLRVVKAVTTGYVRGYQWDGTSLRDSVNPLLLDLCLYEPTETSPDYLHSRLHGWFPHNASCAFRRITALVKLAFVPVVNPNDLVLIENEDALCHMIQSIRYREAGNAGAATQFELDAFRELNYQLRDRFPIEQLTIDFRPFGSADFSRVTGGFY